MKGPGGIASRTVEVTLQHQAAVPDDEKGVEIPCLFSGGYGRIQEIAIQSLILGGSDRPIKGALDVETLPFPENIDESGGVVTAGAEEHPG